MKSLKEIKNSTQKKVIIYKQTGEDRLNFNVYFGTKKFDISINGTIQMQILDRDGQEKVVTRTRKLAEVSSKMELVNHNQLFVSLFYSITNIYNDSIYGFKDINIAEETLRQMISISLEFWKQYKEMKSFSAIYFNYNGIRKETISKIFKEEVFASGFEVLNGFRKILIKPEEYPLRYGIVAPELKEKICRVIDLDKEVNELINQLKTFVIEERDYREDSFMYNLEAAKFYYDNERFRIFPSDNGILVKGEMIEERKFPYKKGVAKDILEYVSEQKRMYNLFNPPIKNIKTLFENLFNVSLENDIYEKLVQETDNIIGLGETENECIEIASVVRQNKSKDSYDLKYDKEIKEKYKAFVNDTFMYYRIKTNKYIWHILTDRYFQIWLLPSFSLDYPEYIHNGIKEIMDRVLKQ